jgi:hypothetical protein
MAGAVVGGAFGYLYLTDRGRELREDVEPAVSDLIGELRKAWETAEQARTAVSEAWGPVARSEDDVNLGTDRP